MPSYTSVASRGAANRAVRIAGGAFLVIAAIFAFVMNTGPASAAGESWELPKATLDIPSTSTSETVVLAGGCFWGVQAVYEFTSGVTSAISGYSGGSADTAEYYTVGSGTTGHAESVEVTFNPQEISFAEILRIFFSVAHDPTQLNFQGPDHGTQYRSHIYYTTDEQRQVAEAYIAQLDAANVYGAPIVTRLDALEAFYPAEDYHQDYLLLHPNSAYIMINDIPKVNNLSTLFPEYWRDTPVMVAQVRPDLV